MALGLIDDTKLTNIANAIRTKGGTSATLTPDEMVTAIGNISTGTDYLPQRIQNTLISYDIPNGVTSIAANSFNGCSSLTTITIPNTVTTIGNNAFFECTGLTSITIPDSVTSIGMNAFEYCYSLTNAIIGNKVKNIGSSAFYWCRVLSTVTIGSAVTQIGNYAFVSGSTTNKTTFTVLATTPPTLGTGVFATECLEKIIVPSGTLSAYQSAWSAYASYIEEA